MTVELDPLGRRRLVKGLAASSLFGMAPLAAAVAGPAPRYRALVCVFLQGGNDGENTLVPFDDRGYGRYASIRTPASGLNIAQRDLLPVQPAGGGEPLGLHPSCAPLRTLFERGELAVVANVGMLSRPSTKSGLEVLGEARPANLFSHTDQQRALQSGDARGVGRSGWGGRIGERLSASGTRTPLPPVVSMHGLETFALGADQIPLTVSPHLQFSLASSAPGQQHYDRVRERAMREILSHPTPNVYERAAIRYARQGLDASATIDPILRNPRSIVPAYFEGLRSNLAYQLRAVAMLIEGRGDTGSSRQVFFVNQQGYDTHAAQLPVQGRLLGELASALYAFQAALKGLGVSEGVTTFTLSDFGRTLKPASSQGTDHGWGNYAFVLGSSVRGGALYGTRPAYALGGPDDLGRDGRWIPSTSLEQFGVPLTLWLGVAQTDLPYVFPNLGAFPGQRLDFMKAPVSTG